MGRFNTTKEKVEEKEKVEKNREIYFDGLGILIYDLYSPLN